MRSVLWMIPVFALFAAVSCEFEPEFISTPASPQREADVPPASGKFEPAACGRVTGRVTWIGDRPAPPPFLFGAPAPDGNFTVQVIPNPNAPTIDEKSRAVAGAVVFLRGIGPESAKPWNLPPVRVEMKDRSIRMIQGDSPPGRIGFVRRGDTVEMRSAEPVFHSLRARGAAFFSLAFPKPDQPLSRTFDSPGRVELSSGAGFYWASADLFVVEHPYYTRTDANGRFAFEQVPPGAFEVVSWLPGWTVTRQERDPETGLVTRQSYGPPIEVSHKAKLDPKGVSDLNISMK